MRKFGVDISNNPLIDSNYNENVTSSKANKHRALTDNEVKINLTLKGEQILAREVLLKWLIAHCRPTLELRDSTIEHSIRLFDCYCSRSMRMNSDFEEAQLDLLACLFISAKYEEIYPPNTSDFEYVSKYRFTTADILKRELEVLTCVEYNLMIPTASHWYITLFAISPPEWFLLSYIVCLPKTSMKDLAIAIHCELQPILANNNECGQKPIQEILKSLKKKLQ